ncbi:DUF3566 domain-containing protein [Agrococcus sediminis]|jgi:hypothetical protein|uniref:DUF3566 domain-containing protein n=1 Tax=Agrococcus sediminis TaxID=2599924 RepID=A0A5M8QJ06_9MICO|nr:MULTISPECIES: DUF3566 domain-containing protein [Agrococcus]KAA6436127.1 DUF3566 domain-containing protein [Agrococcus sediminis]MDR7233816.1 hypothetical protein [Agrococcus sp. BE272]RWR17610.1 DUF3566 domain-containing protein [Agrococcus lahaulensis]UOW01696.1 DUF3566 domain-containing protein [Agrococcus sp. SCSIO52902]
MSIAEKLQSKSPRRSGSSKQVRLRLVHIDFWSAMKVSAVLGLVLGIVQLVVTFVVWTLLQIVGLFGKVDEVMRDILADPDFAITSLLSLPQVMMFTLLVAVLNFVVITVLGAVIAVLYNLSVRLTGGLQVGFANQ